MSLGIAALISVGQWFALTGIIGVGERTDAFLAAYSIYLPVVLLASSLRGALPPLVGPLAPESTFRSRAMPVASRTALLGWMLGGLLLLCSPVAALLLTRGLGDEARQTAALSLILLAFCGVLQFRAATIATLLGMVRRFQVSAALYIGCGGLGLASSVAALALVGPVGAAVGLLTGSLLLAGGHSVYARRLGLRLRLKPRWALERRQGRLGLALFSVSSLGLAHQVNVSIALAGVSGRPGAITVYTFAIYMLLILLNVTSVALSIVLLPDLIAEIGRRGPAAATDYAIRVLAPTFAIVTPLLAAYLAGGHTILQAILNPVLEEPDIDLMFSLGKVFCLLVIPVALIQVAVSIGSALRRGGTILALSAASVLLQLVAVTIAAGGGPVAVAAAHTTTGAVIAIGLMMALFGGGTLTLLAKVTRAVAPAFALSLIVLAVRLPLGADPGLLSVTGALSVGLLLYALLVVRFWPKVSRPFLAAFRRHPGQPVLARPDPAP